MDEMGTGTGLDKPTNRSFSITWVPLALCESP
jgi:hypothetical protein